MRTSGRLRSRRGPCPLLVAVRPQQGQPSWRALRDARCDAYAMPSQHALVRTGPQRAIADLTLGWKTLVLNTIDVSRHWFVCNPPYRVRSITLINKMSKDQRQATWKLHKQPGPPAWLRGASQLFPQRLPVGYIPPVLRGVAVQAGPDYPEKQGATYSLPRCSWSKLSGGAEFGCNLFIMQIDSIEAICTKLMEKLHPSKARHSCGLPGTQLAQLKELGCGKKPHFSSKLLLGHF